MQIWAVRSIARWVDEAPPEMLPLSNTLNSDHHLDRSDLRPGFCGHPRYSLAPLKPSTRRKYFLTVPERYQRRQSLLVQVDRLAGSGPHFSCPTAVTTILTTFWLGSASHSLHESFCRRRRRRRVSSRNRAERVSKYSRVGTNGAISLQLRRQGPACRVLLCMAFGSPSCDWISHAVHWRY